MKAVIYASVILIISQYWWGFLYSQSTYISIQPFDHTGVDKKVAEEIIYSFENQFRKSTIVTLVSTEQESDFMNQYRYQLVGGILTNPIQLQNMFHRYKLVRGRIDLFPEHYLLFSEMVDMHTGSIESVFQFKGGLEDILTKGVDGMILEFSSRIAKFIL